MPSGKIAKLSGLDGIASGSLLHLSDMKVGAFTNEFAKWGSGVGALARAIYGFVPEGKNAGAGRLSYGMAQAAKEWVQAAILTKEGRQNNVASGFLGPERRDPDYIEWVEKLGLSDQNTMHLMGAIGGNFGVIKKSGAGHTLGIKQNTYIRPPVVGSYPLAFSRTKVKVADYAEAVERGMGMPARPIMSGAIAKFLETIQPQWATLFKAYMVEQFKLGEKEKVPGAPKPKQRRASKGRTKVVSIEKLHDAIPSSDFTEGADYWEAIDEWVEGWVAKGASGQLIKLDVQELVMFRRMVENEIGKHLRDQRTLSNITNAMILGEEVPSIYELSLWKNKT